MNLVKLLNHQVVSVVTQNSQGEFTSSATSNLSQIHCWICRHANNSYIYRAIYVLLDQQGLLVRTSEWTSALARTRAVVHIAVARRTALVPSIWKTRY